MTVKEIETIGTPEIDPAAARRAFLEYRKAATAEKDAALKAEYAALMRGYRAIAAGRKVIDLHQTMQAAGLNDALYPKLAIARADGRTCFLSMREDGSARMSHVARPQWRHGRPPAHTIVFPAGTFPPGTRSWKQCSAQALVPMVPPQFHPGPALANYWILWDAVWTQAPPVDPLLLKHLAGALYAIVAAWDLSPLEMAVMRGRL